MIIRCKGNMIHFPLTCGYNLRGGGTLADEVNRATPRAQSCPAWTAISESKSSGAHLIICFILGIQNHFTLGLQSLHLLESKSQFSCATTYHKRTTHRSSSQHRTGLLLPLPPGSTANCPTCSGSLTASREDHIAMVLRHHHRDRSNNMVIGIDRFKPSKNFNSIKWAGDCERPCAKHW